FLYTHRNPPLSTLFPYTTLFRSSFELGDERGRCGSLGESDPGVLRLLCVELDAAHPAGDEVVERCTDERGDEAEEPVEDRQDDEDRKSTRLNSSHVSISYAVFCL